MFGSKAKSEAEPTVIGRGTVIEGTLRVSGPVQLDGQIEGALISEGPVAIGPTGSVFGDVVASELELAGHVEGKVTVRDHLHVAQGASARGELRYGSLQVDRGGVITGSAQHGEAPPALEELPNQEPRKSHPALPASAAVRA